MEKLNVTSSAFKDGDLMPKKYTGFGEDVSPKFQLFNLSEDAVSIAIIMDDLDVPFVKEYNHWVIWNIPVMQVIPEHISHGACVKELGNAVQGIGWGKNEYRGPKQPIFVRNEHRYKFRFYVLDKMLDLESSKGKKELLTAMEGHVLQEGCIVGRYKR